MHSGAYDMSQRPTRNRKSSRIEDDSPRERRSVPMANGSSKRVRAREMYEYDDNEEEDDRDSQPMVDGDVDGDVDVDESGAEDDELTGGHLEVGEIAAVGRRMAVTIDDISMVPQGGGKLINPGLAKDFLSLIMRSIFFMNLNKQKCTTQKVRNAVFTKPDTPEEKTLKLAKIAKAKEENTKMPTFQTQPRHNITVGNKGKDALFGLAMAGFEDLFGYDLVATHHAPVLKGDFAGGVQPKTKRKRANDDGEEQFAVRAKSPDDLWLLLDLKEDPKRRRDQAKTRVDNNERGVLLVLLGAMMLNKGSMLEPQMITLLDEQLGLPPPPGKDARGIKKVVKNIGCEFGNAGDLLGKLVSEGYLTRRKTDQFNSKDQAVWELSYGPKTTLEIGVPNILRFLKATGVSMSEQEVNDILDIRK